MKKLPKTYAMVILLFSCLSVVSAQGLKETTEQFTQLITQTSLSSEDFIAKLKPYIDPEANADSICLDYYTHWKSCSEKGYYPLETTIEEITKDSKTTATVLISNIWHCNGGESYFFLSHTVWVKKGDRWFRSTDEATILASSKIENEE